MVWFQCEDCGENLKKPKLQTHFRTCSAGKLSCIDCGVIFNQQSVQNHTQCVSEAEKYGPKAVGSVKEALKTKVKEQNVDESGLDTSVGLSTRAPWSCSLCNVKATSQETLLLHAQGKKHRSKARAMSTKLPPKSGSEFACNKADVTMETASSVSHKNSFGLVEGNAFGKQRNVLEDKADQCPDSEIEQMHKQTSTKLLDQKRHQEASGLNGTSFSHLCDTDGNSVEKEKESRRKKRKVTNDWLKPNDAEKSDKKCKKDGEDGRRKVDCTNLVNQQKHVGLSSNGCSFEQRLSATTSDRSSRKAPNFDDDTLLTRRKSIGEKMDKPAKPSEHEGSDVSWEDIKDVSGGLANRKKRKNGAQFTNAYNQSQESSLDGWLNLVKWKKLIRRAFKDASNGPLTIKLLRKSVLPQAMKSLETSGILPDEKSLRIVLDSKIRTYKKLIIDGKKVRLAKNDNAE